jgi:hypothetical protein
MVMALAAFWFAGLAVSAAGADIYAWTDENGVKYFTNHAPPEQATLFMKTREIPYDEEADNQRREMDRLEVARQELAEREAFLQEQQQPMPGLMRRFGKRTGFCRMRRLHLKTPIIVIPAVTDTVFIIPITDTDPAILTKATSVSTATFIKKDTRTNTLPNIPFITATSEKTVSEALTP